MLNFAITDSKTLYAENVCLRLRMIKRIAAISVSFILSVVIVALGAGVSFVRCCHMQTAAVAQLPGISHHDDASGDGNVCCGHYDNGHGDRPEIDEADCMKVTVVQLFLTVVADHEQTAGADIVFFAVPHVFDIYGYRYISAFVECLARPVSCIPHSSPRDYLRLIRVLLI